MRPRRYTTNAERQQAYRERKRNAPTAPIVTLPMPYYQDRWVTLYCASCLDILPLLDTNSIDLVLTDPPYEAEAHTRGRRQRAGRGVAERPIPFAAIDDRTRAHSAAQMARLARRWVLTFCQVEAAMTWRTAYEAVGLEYRRSCVWIKPDGAPQFTGDRPGMGYETIVAMHPPGRSRWNGGGRHGVFTYPTDDRGDALRHPTQKPLRLMRDLIALFSDPNELILDAFAGCGTTLRAAKEMGRRAIGIELSERYCEIAAMRLCQDVMDLEVAA